MWPKHYQTVLLTKEKCFIYFIAYLWTLTRTIKLLSSSAIQTNNSLDLKYNNNIGKTKFLVDHSLTEHF